MIYSTNISGLLIFATPSGFCLMWTPINVDSRLMWTFYQERNHFLYYVYYITLVNMDKDSVNVDNPTPKHVQQRSISLLRHE